MTPPVSGGLPEQGLRDDQAIEAIRSDEAVRDAFVDCYTVRGIMDDETERPVTEHWCQEWERVEAVLIRTILARAALARPRPALPAPEPPHPEDFCQQCGRPNIVWFAPNEVWNKVVPDGGILCPVCFVQEAERAGIQPPAWEVRPEGAALPAPEPPDLAGLTRDELISVCDLYRRRLADSEELRTGLADALNKARAALPAEHAPPEPSEAAKLLIAKRIAGLGDQCFDWDDPPTEYRGAERIAEDKAECLELAAEILGAAYAVDRARPALAGSGPDFFAQVALEAEAAIAKWPDEEIFHRLAALSGEVGELAEGVIKGAPDVQREAVQVAACAYRCWKVLRGTAGSPE